MNFSTNDTMTFKKIIEDIIDVRMNKKGITNYVSAVVSSINSDFTVNVYLPPDRNNIASSLINKSGEVLAVGDSVEVCTKNGSLANAWIAIKHGKGYPGDSLSKVATSGSYDDLNNKPFLTTYVAMSTVESIPISAITYTESAFSSVTIKDDYYVSNNSNRIIVKVAGTYRISYSVRWEDVSTINSCSAGFSINGSLEDNNLQFSWATNRQRLTMTSSKICDLAVGDTISGLYYSSVDSGVKEGTYWIEKIG